MFAELKFAGRAMRKSPVFAITAVVTIALGIGANTAIFSVMNAALLRTLPVRDPQQLFYLTHQHEPGVVNTTGDSQQTYGINVYERLRQDSRAFADVIAYAPLSRTKTAARRGDFTEEVEADEVSGSFFSGLGVQMWMGDGFTTKDEEAHSAIAVISYGYWARGFARDPNVLGKALYLNGVPMTVVGVAAPHFYGIESGGSATDVWVPLQNRPELNAWGIPTTEHSLYGSPNWWCLMLIVRLKAGVSQSQTLARADPLFAHAAWETIGNEVTRTSEPMQLQMIPARGLGLSAADYKQPTYVLMGMVAVVLVIACLNLLVLLAARNVSREREFSVRLALGASRWPLFRQLLADSTLLTGTGAILGLGFAVLATRLLAQWSRIEVSLEPDATVLGFTLTVTTIVALVFGLVPLCTAATVPMTIALNSASSRSSDSRSRVLRSQLLVVAQMALCLPLLFGAGLLIQTLRNYGHVDLGMRADRVLAFRTHPVGVADNRTMLTFYTRLAERLRELPGVQSVSMAEQRPGSGWTDAGLLTLDGRHYQYDDGRGLLYYNVVGSDYFETLEIPILMGRGITAEDSAASTKVAVVNQTFVDRFFKGSSPIGHTLNSGTATASIVGVVRNNKYQEAGEEPRAMAWYSFRQSPTIDTMDVELRVAGDPMTMLPQIRRLVREIAMDAPVQNPMTLQSQFKKGYELPLLLARLGVFFGGLAALLLAVGLYGTLAYRVNRRTMEIGLRIALGAARGRVLWMVVRESLMMVVAGLAIGLPLAWIGSRLMASVLYDMQPQDPISLAIASVTVLTVSLVAAAIPARRAASIQAMCALRSE
jgi:predicted permease